MPDQPAGERTEPTDAVKEHLRKSNVHAHELPDKVIEKHNMFSGDELNTMFDLVDKNGLADQLEEAHLAPKQIICAVH
jgi:hypothetical protein